MDDKDNDNKLKIEDIPILTYFKECPMRKKKFNVHSIQEVVTVVDTTRSMP